MNSKTHIAGRAPGSSTRSLRSSPSPVVQTISPASISRTNSAPMMSMAHDSLAITGWPSKSPRQSGRTPNGSRKPTTFLPVSTAAEKAPRMRATASRTEPSRSLSACWAMSAVMTSVSVPDLNSTPCPRSSSRSSVVLTRLPLWARAMVCWPRERVSGWEFCQAVAPVVE